MPENPLPLGMGSVNNKISEDPYVGQRFVGEENPVMIERLKEFCGEEIKGFYDECEEPKILVVIIGNAEILLGDPTFNASNRSLDCSEWKLADVTYDNGYVLSFKNEKHKKETLSISGSSVLIDRMDDEKGKDQKEN